MYTSLRFRTDHGVFARYLAKDLEEAFPTAVVKQEGRDVRVIASERDVDAIDLMASARVGD